METQGRVGEKSNSNKNINFKFNFDAPLLNNNLYMAHSSKIKKN